MLTQSGKREDFARAIRQLKDLANTIALTYLSAGSSRKAFNNEIRNFINAVTREVDNQCMSIPGGIKTIQEQIDSLKQQQFQLMTDRMIQYAAIEKRKQANGYVNLLVKQVGFVGGGTQIVAGYGVCAASKDN